MNRKTNTLEVIKAFYMAEVLLKEINVDDKKNSEVLEKQLIEISRKAGKLSTKKILNYFFDAWSQRYDNYMNSEWELKEIDMDECGVWPKMGNLPEYFTYGNVADTAGHVKELLENRDKITYKTSRVLYIDELVNTSELIFKYIPPIVVEGGLIRNNKLRDSKNKENYKKCKYDIDDGNHRILARYLSGEKTVLAWVGKRIYKNNLLY